MSIFSKIIFVSIFTILCISLFPCTAFADEYGIEATAQVSGLSRYSSDLNSMIGSTVGAALSIISVIFFILMIYGGFRWMTARGSEENTKKSLEIIFSSIIGIIIIVSAYVVTKFVLESVGPKNPGDTGTVTAVTACLNAQGVCEDKAEGAVCYVAEFGSLAECQSAIAQKEAIDGLCQTHEDCATGNCDYGICKQATTPAQSTPPTGPAPVTRTIPQIIMNEFGEESAYCCETNSSPCMPVGETLAKCLSDDPREVLVCVQAEKTCLQSSNCVEGTCN